MYVVLDEGIVHEFGAGHVGANQVLEELDESLRVAQEQMDESVGGRAAGFARNAR